MIQRWSRIILMLSVATVAAFGLPACFGGGEQIAAEEVEVVENRRYGVLSDGYELEEGSVKSGETMGAILAKYGRSNSDIYYLEKRSKSVFPLNKIRIGNRYTAFLSVDSLGVKSLDHLAYEITNIDYALFSFVDDTITSLRASKPTTAKRHCETATIESSMWLAANEAGMPNALSYEIENIYQWTVDFFSISKGDSFTVIYDELFVDDTVSIGLGQVWGAKFLHAEREYYAIPYKQGEQVQFWEEDGGSLRKLMLKAPLKYTRISSGFSYSRFHPIHKVYRPHTGVDYAAPIGTEVHSVADGVVVYKGWYGGGGNTLKIKHAGGFTTGYMHLNSYSKGIAVGTTVKQGQTIGYVGSTGDSTGPHLDYRVWKGTTPINPLTLPQEATEPIKAENLAGFEYVKSRIIAELNGELEGDEYITNLDDIPLPEPPPADSIILAQK